MRMLMMMVWMGKKCDEAGRTQRRKIKKSRFGPNRAEEPEATSQKK